MAKSQNLVCKITTITLKGDCLKTDLNFLNLNKL